MDVRFGLITAVTVLALMGSPHAQTVIRPEPNQAGTFRLGVVTGIGYYTVTPNGFHVVLTITKDQNRPVRFETVLARGQSITLSAPRELGSESQVIEIKRDGDTLVVTEK